MSVPKLNLQVKENKKEQNLKSLDNSFNYKKFYEVVSDIDCVVCANDFKKGEVKKMTGLLAKACVVNGDGHIMVVDPEAKKAELDKKAEKEALKNELLDEIESKKGSKKESNKDSKKDSDK